MNKFISIASLFIIYAILIVSSNGKTTTMLQENLKKRATSTSEQSMYIQKMISKKRFGASSAGAIATDDKQCDEEKSRLQDEIEALRAEVKDLKEKADKPSRPRICCQAMTKKCLACSKGVSVEEFCKTNSGKFGCPPTKPSICPMPMCAAVMPRPGCKHVMTKEKNERGCPKHPCGKEECEPEIIGKPEKCPESVDRCKVGEKRVKDPNVYWNDLVQFRPRRGLLNKENALPPSAMLDRCGYVYICVPDTKKCPAKEPRHCPVARCRPPSKGCKYVQDDERKENCCRKHICGIEKCGEMPEEIEGNNKGNNKGDYIEYDAQKNELEDYLNGLCRGGKGIEDIKYLLDTTRKDDKGRVLLRTNCYKDDTCDCVNAGNYTGPFKSVNIDICKEDRKDLNFFGEKDGGSFNAHRKGESNQNKYLSHMKDQHIPHIIAIHKTNWMLEWCFVKNMHTVNQCKIVKYCPGHRRRRLLNKGDCGS